MKNRQFNLRRLAFWTAIFCLFLAVFRYPLGYFFSNFNASVFQVPFLHLKYLIGMNPDYPTNIPKSLPLIDYFTCMFAFWISGVVHFYLISGFFNLISYFYCKTHDLPLIEYKPHKDFYFFWNTVNSAVTIGFCWIIWRG